MLLSFALWVYYCPRGLFQSDELQKEKINICQTFNDFLRGLFLQYLVEKRGQAML